ncbi:hypothetical protein [Andreprevotia chitinilytica]|uniref:hypothetical protein n=1 Tax=Andreprevotia chitinilytica TaxID=396808 RepID=UPI00054E556F|nr:hypothetical protein [Andreprevotia chitinilytica]
MHLRAIPLCLAAVLFSNAAMSQQPPSVYSESRDAASSFIGTTNFVVGRLGRDCLALLGRPETAEEFVSTWQSRNAKYVSAAGKYIRLRSEEAFASGGASKRDAVLGELADAATNGGRAAVQDMFQRGDKGEICKRVIALIDSGGMDFSPKFPMFDELGALVAWAK